MTVVPYNSTAPTGGDSVTEDLNRFYDKGDIAWIIMATALVLLMIPGVGFFYSGLSRRNSALSLLFLSIATPAIAIVQWMIIGYSLTFSRSSGPFVGNFEAVGLRNILARPSLVGPRIPDLLFASYQDMFSAITITIITGAQAERGRLSSMMVFVFIWLTLIYDPIACWHWNPHGWVARHGGLDFAGGTPVHVTAGCSCLALSQVLGRRQGYGTRGILHRPQNVDNIVLGTVLLFFGWFGFNGGSALGADLRATTAAANTVFAACVGGLTWCCMDYRHTRQWSTVGLCSGIVAGLVGITPGSGFVPIWSSMIIGLLSAMAAHYGTKIPAYLKIDDALDIFAVHAVSGFVGTVLTGVFAADYVAHLDGYTVIPGGWLNGHWIQVAWQVADSLAGGLYSYLGTFVIAICMDQIPGLKLRVSAAIENSGVDEAQLGEVSYDHIAVHSDVDQMVDDRMRSQRTERELAEIKAFYINRSFDDGNPQIYPPQNSFQSLHGGSTAVRSTVQNSSVAGHGSDIIASVQVDRPSLSAQVSGEALSTAHKSFHTNSSVNQGSFDCSYPSAPSGSNSQITVAPLRRRDRSDYEHGEKLINESISANHDVNAGSRGPVMHPGTPFHHSDNMEAPAGFF